MADRMLYIWIVSLISLSVVGGIILPTYLIAFDFDYNYPQFWDELYSLKSSQNSMCTHCKICHVNESLDGCVSTKENLVQKKALYTGNLDDINKRRLYRENCILNYNGVSNVLIYLSLTFVIISAFKSV
jgi:hypothetical protein